MKLSSTRVETILADCLFTDAEAPGAPETIPDDAIVVECILHSYALHAGRLEGYRIEIAEMLRELPEEFQRHGGGGGSFLALCADRHGRQWTGLHLQQERLCALAIGLKLARWSFPRNVWPALPGGLPYLSVTADFGEVS